MKCGEGYNQKTKTMEELRSEWVSAGWLEC
jgi:hypothetical protein